MKEKDEVSDYQKEKQVNDLQRATFIYKTMQELTTDLMVCKLMYDFSSKEAKKSLEEWKTYLEDFIECLQQNSYEDNLESKGE